MLRDFFSNIGAENSQKVNSESDFNENSMDYSLPPPWRPLLQKWV